MANRCQCFNTSFVAKTSAIFFYIDNAKAPIITNLHKLVANHLFCHELRYFENIIKMMVAFFLTEQSIVKDGEVIYLFLHFLLLLFFVGLLMFFLWLLFFVVVVFLAFLLVCCCPVSSKDFVINLQLIWRKMLCSNPGRTVTIRTAVLLTNSYVRIFIVSCIVCNVDIIGTKSWKIVIVAVCGVLIAVVYVLFEISITVVVFQ